MQYRYAVFGIQNEWFGAIFSLAGLYYLTLPQMTEEYAREQLPLARYPQIEEVRHAGILKEDLELYIGGEKMDFHTTVDWSDYTFFQRQVLQFTAAIPYGQAVAYGDVAVAIGRPKACRAVGQALHINRTPIIVPCHRVMAGGGKIGGFGGGLACKRRLLDLENIGYKP